MRAVFFVGYAALCFCLATEARAQPAPDATRTVTLKSGAIFRGELIELVPLDHITIKLATGDIKRFAWADLNEAPPPPPAQFITPPPPVALPPPPPMAAVGTPLPPPGWPVHIDSDAPSATLYRENGIAPINGYAGGGYISGTMHMYVPVCRAPCDEPVDRLGAFSIRGNDIAPSREFSLPMSGPVRLNVHAWSIGKQRLGFGLIILGGLLTAGGVALIAGGANAAIYESNPSAQQLQALQSRRTSYYAGGGVMLGVGFPAFIAGLVMGRLRSSVEIF